MEQKSLTISHLTLGVCYYPEQWDCELWPSDLAKMEQLGLEVIRIGEFAWSIIEPSEGVYDFSLFDRFLALVEKSSLKVIFGTPTAAPPVWLTERYPEVLNARVDGVLYRHGLRRHYSYNSPTYRRLSAAVVEQLAMRYGRHPSVLGWQIDNELNGELNEFYSNCDHTAFREFLKEKYCTLNALNKAWGTVFWSQQYTSWEQVWLRRPTSKESANPHMLLDQKRFFSASCIDFCRMQADILRRWIGPEQFLTTNGMFPHLNSCEMTDTALDFFSYDCYPNFAYFVEGRTDRLKDRLLSFTLSKVRSISPTFCIMEQQSGANGWVNRIMSSSPKSGQMRLWTYQSLAHGADLINYFRWRTCSFGTEMYWQGVWDCDNRPNRRVHELRTISNEFSRLASLAGTVYHARIALLHDYDNEWDGELDLWHGRPTVFSEHSWFEATTLSHTPLDVVQLRPDLQLEHLRKYRLVVYPHPAILSEKTAQLLQAYVEQGGTLIFGGRSGYKDSCGHRLSQPAPGYVSRIFGILVDDSTDLYSGESAACLEGPNLSVEGALFFESIVPLEETSVNLFYYANGPFCGGAGMSERELGYGTAVYYASAFSPEAVRLLLDRYEQSEPFRDLFSLPPECELAVREKDDRRFFFVLNYSASPATIFLHRTMYDLLTGQTFFGRQTLSAYGVFIFMQTEG